jgi:hypothetical protein
MKSKNRMKFVELQAEAERQLRPWYCFTARREKEG